MEYMTNISFTSSYRIPMIKTSAKSVKRAKLNELATRFPNSITESHSGSVRVSMPNKEDAGFIRDLKMLGFKIFQQFDGENIPKHKLTAYIKDELKIGHYKQFGKQKRKLTKPAKVK